MIKILSKLLSLLYKKRCYFCKKTNENSIMCDECFKKIQYFAFKSLKKIKGVDIYCVTLYKNNIQKLIRGLKYHNQRELAVYQAKIMFEYWKNLKIANEDFVVVPVPLFHARQKVRKYNHMLLVANEFCRLCPNNYEVADNLILRIKDTKPQYKLTKTQREENLKNAFALCDNYEYFKDKKILIIDDILTTGSTLKEIISTFQKHGFTNIYGFVTSCSEYNII